MFKFDISDSGHETKRPQEAGTGSKIQKAQKALFFEDIDTVFDDEKGDNFYGQLAKLIHNSKVPIIASCHQKVDRADLDFLDQLCDANLNGLGVDISYEACYVSPNLKASSDMSILMKLI